jgi:hypothetical protein
MPGLVPGIHDLPTCGDEKDLDGRDKPGHDDGKMALRQPAPSPMLRMVPLPQFMGEDQATCRFASI